MATSMEQIVVKHSRPQWTLTARASKSFMQASFATAEAKGCSCQFSPNKSTVRRLDHRAALEAAGFNWARADDVCPNGGPTVLALPA